MCDLEQFRIDLKGLADGETPIDYSLDDGFFQALEAQDVQGGSLHVSGTIRKSVGFFELKLHIAGTVRIPCDRCLEPMDQPVDTSLRLILKLAGSEAAGGEAVSGYQSDDVVSVNDSKPVFSTAWPVYESIVLAVPIQHVHQLGGCNEAMMRVLSEHSAARSSDADAQETVDPRWEALKKLKI